MTQHKVTNALLDTFHTMVPLSGSDVARQHTLQLALEQQIVDSAYLDGGSTLLVFFKEMPAPLHIMLQAIGPRHEPDLINRNDEFKEQRLRNSASALRSWLISGHLVVVQSGGYRQAVGPPNGQIAFEELKRIVTQIDDLEARTIAIRGIITDDSAAAQIARQFMQ